MPELRAALEASGFQDVTSYVASGNVVLRSQAAESRVVERVHAIVESRFGLDIAIVVRSAAEMAALVKRDPLADVALDPKRHLVTFLSSNPPGELVEGLRRVAASQEQVVVLGREIHSWHPAGFARSPLWGKLSARSLGVTATSRNWSTVTALQAMAEGKADR